MMAEIGSDVGLNTNVNVGNKVFHVQTATLNHKNIVKSEIYEHGKILTVFEYSFEELGLSNNSRHEELRQLVSEIHQEKIGDIEMLFDMSQKIRTVKHSVSNNKMGLVFLNWNMLKEAIEEFELAITHDANYVDAYNNMGRAYIEMGEYSKALESLKKANSINANYPDVHNNLGVAYMESGEYDLAFAEFNDAVRINEKFYEAYINTALALIRYAKNAEEGYENSPKFYEQLLKNIKTAFEILSGENIQAYQRIYKSIQLKQYEVAAFLLVDLKKHMHRERSIVNITDLFYLKFMFGGEGKNDSTIFRYERLLQERLKHTPQYADLHNSLGILHIIQCRNFFLKAIEDFKHAIEINSKYDGARKNLKLAENDGRGFLILLRAILK
ncbi:tetratricopeptide repeat protein [bacterium]|nr:tetratricopeptide repeat protein [bacterium]